MTSTETRVVLPGTPASAGAAVGPVVRVPEPLGEPPAGPSVPEDRRETEAARIAPAGAAVSTRMMDTAGTPGLAKEVSDVLYATAMMAEDPALLESAAELVRDHGTPAPRAVHESAARFVAALQAAGGYLAERAGDVADIRDRIVAELLGVPAPGVPALDRPSVLVARDLAPADTATLDPTKALALVTVEGGPTSHTAILARSLGVPAVVGCPGAETLAEGVLVRVDGVAGEVVEVPAGTAVGADTAAAGPSVVEGPVTTRDGRRIAIVANIADAKDARRAAEVGAEGVGLLRTELTFLSAATEPTEADQRAGYAATMAPLRGTPVTVRTLDAGADKPVPFLAVAPEVNPALGVRGQRLFDEAAGDAAERSSTIGSADRAGVLDRQLAAVVGGAADAGVELKVMAPMISTADEAARFVARARAAGAEQVGVMIEVPAAVLNAPELLAEVDFVSVGTNDLTQYVFAADRQSGPLAGFNDPWQPAVLRLLDQLCRAAAITGTPVGVCGEAAADPALAVVLVGLGVTSLSAAASALPAVAARVASVDVATAQRAARAAVSSRDVASARAAVRDLLG
ncbi:phosphoenolpyruvate--protein phosphotransferase [Actinomycetospora endophytica]|uniref:Phosphoenolpyruvate-protein phosphotransferase n=1 Tax=Actinomycetospora endophytica TaxID=2291215 RepID=A0ABS8P2M1_9PSEU|nr:putative PEP-binding protein [Actinomycetospora endophytica]MCD2192486.1 phosphoenolpyruvate--protein phosphotransferase [Actinomycetospora endophytica]